VSDWQKRYELLENDMRELASAMAHDLRAPLRAVDGFSRALAGECAGRLEGEADRYLGLVRDSARRAGVLADGLVALARLSVAPVRRQPVDLSALAWQLLAELQAAERGRNVQAQIAPELWVEADPQMLAVLLSSLLSNAWKFTAPVAAPRIQLDRQVQDSRPIYRVADNGVGFDMGRTERLFQPFGRLHASHEFPGLGLGLARARRVVGRHGGEIWAASSPGKGSTFSFTL
jgi:signal transduction histidine kinase